MKNIMNAIFSIIYKIFNVMVAITWMGLFIWVRFIRDIQERDIYENANYIIFIIGCIWVILHIHKIFLNSRILYLYLKGSKEFEKYLSKKASLFIKLTTKIYNTLIYKPFRTLDETILQYIFVILYRLFCYAIYNLREVNTYSRQGIFIILLIIPRLIICICFGLDIVLYEKLYYFYRFLPIIVITLLITAVLDICGRFAIKEILDEQKYVYFVDENNNILQLENLFEIKYIRQSNKQAELYPHINVEIIAKRIKIYISVLEGLATIKFEKLYHPLFLFSNILISILFVLFWTIYLTKLYFILEIENIIQTLLIIFGNIYGK